MFGFRIAATLLVFSMLLSVLGCGPTLYQPTVKITKGGAPLKVSEKGRVMVKMFAESDTSMGDPQAVNPDSEGTFKIGGKTGAGVPAGKYKVSIEVFDPFTNDGTAKDQLAGKKSKANSPVIEVKDSSTPIEIDVGK